eukprot:TRINITY_DN97_c0_g1_i1.p1 TRINITY_DN97_c0_g1~~TRINITY_DN97_c0_g1_i1.p1  ORF type:complete len:639 (+),score=174.61 TRINITY_DN97_c0_g1_i1:37-1953(+)
MSSSDDDLPLAARKRPASQPAAASDSDSDVPLAQRKRAHVQVTKQPPAKKPAIKKEAAAAAPGKKVKKEVVIIPEIGENVHKWWEDEGDRDGKNWTTLQHNGVWFPPEYKPHGVRMLYDGKPVKLTPAQEEIATFYAVAIGSQNADNDVFRQNFFKDWRKVLGKDHIIKEFDKCDFMPIKKWAEEQKELKKKATPEEKAARKLETQQLTEHYGFALVDGHKEKVGNFRMEVPGLFRGRGKHPKTGKVKKRVMPEDVTLNLSKDAKVPKCPMEGHSWGGIVHKPDVSWLATFKDPILDHVKYVWFAAASSFKGKSDFDKFEKARKLKDHIDEIRSSYNADMKKGKDVKTKQLATAVAIIDQLALRVGNEKGEDEADTVGCCSLRVEHIKLEAPTTVHFDFLGKDSIRYQNSVQVSELVWSNLKAFMKDKAPDKELFDKITTTTLNTHLKSFMSGLTAKVFRTYNASVTLQNELEDTPESAEVLEKLTYYNNANRQVAILCNHQRAVPKTFDDQMERLEQKKEQMEHKLKLLKDRKKELQGGKKAKISEDDEKEKLPTSLDACEKAIVKQKIAITNHEVKMKEKDSNKTVSLGTSKINYLDPRITVAWCRKYSVPVSRIFTKTLIDKFPWAMAVDEDFEF